MQFGRTLKMCYVHGSVAVILVCMAAVVDGMMCDETKCSSPSLYALVPDLKGAGPRMLLAPVLTHCHKIECIIAAAAACVKIIFRNGNSEAKAKLS